MPPEQLEEIRAWLTKASHDLQAAEYLTGAAEPLFDVVVYHCQQAMEKSLKGYLTCKGSPFAKTHALVPLVEQAADLDNEFEFLLDHAEYLSPFAWRFRYPGDVLDPDEEETQRALELAGQALEFIFWRIPEEAWPIQDKNDVVPAAAMPPADQTDEMPPEGEPPSAKSLAEERDPERSSPGTKTATASTKQDHGKDDTETGEHQELAQED